LNNSVKNQAILVIFGKVNPEKFSHKTLLICLPYLSDLINLLGKSKKCHFRQYFSYTLLIIYIISEENRL